MTTNSSADKQPRREITRRDFLKLAGAAGAVLTTLPSFIPFGQVVGGSSSGTNNSTNVNRTTSNLDTSINKQTSSVHIFNLDGAIPQFQSPTGSRTLMNADNFPILSRMGAVLLLLKKGGVREPHSHPNAAELNYVINGKVRFTVFGPSGEVETSEIGKGQVFFVPSGYFHYLENPDNVNGSDVASFFNNESPEFIGLAGGLSAYSNEVLGSIFNKDPKFFSTLPRLDKDVFIASGTG
jgi:oxalate decarboxylase